MSDMVWAWLDHAQQLDQAATQGPWEEDGSLIGPRPGASVAQAWGVRWKADGAFIAHARTALPAAVAALRAVSELHAPFQAGRPFCGVCAEADDTAHPLPWPCPTIQAIQAAIGG